MQRAVDCHGYSFAALFNYFFHIRSVDIEEEECEQDEKQ
jgi:hypothetical protein